MKKVNTVFILLGSLFLSLNGISQISLGGTLGFQSNNAQVVGFNQSITPDIKSNPGIRFGLTSAYALNNHWSVVSGAQYNTKSISIKEGTSFNLIGIDIPVGAEARLSTKNVEIPLMLQFETGGDNSFYVKAGTSINYGINGRFKTVANTIIDITLTDNAIDYSSDMFNRTDLTGKMAIGGSTKYGAGKVFAELGYSHGFNQSFVDPLFGTGFRNTAISFNVGYAMNL